MSFFRKIKQKGGFTLIELLVVIAIIGILASVVLASLNTARQKGRDARRIADMKQVQIALELYFDENRAYVAGATWALLEAGLEPTFMSNVPVDPINSGSNVYAYQRCTAVTDYCLVAVLEDGGNPALDSDDDTVGAGCTCATADAAAPFNYNVAP